ncbi:MAG: signal peptidase I [Verrucomicrobiia bacterium]|jgi:signal peptidase I
MINRKDRKALKYAREVFQGAQKWLRINRDLLSSGQMIDIPAKLRALEQALQAGNAKQAASQADELEQKIHGAMPAQRYPAVRENIEVLLVAVIVAMAVRTFFIQPFKIPTGSMQPTLYGIFPPPENMPPQEYKNLVRPSIFEQIVGTIFQGKMYETYGYRSRGDHIFVDKFSYHFRKPHRGEVVVFDTSNIAELGSSRGKFYIKRLIGLENDVIQIRPPYVMVNGQVLDGRDAFKRIYSCTNDYNGYVIPVIPRAPNFPTADSTYTVPAEHLFVLGDNSRSSLDGRFWGSFPRKDLIGKAVWVYWPFTERFGRID